MKMIKEKMNRLKQNKNSGFTLVEVIVVIVIIGMLAALTVPAFTGYLERAKEKKAMSECTQSVISAQTISKEMYETGQGKINGNPNAGVMQEVIELSDIPPTGTIDTLVYSDSMVTELTYTNDGITVIYRNGEYRLLRMGDVATNDSFKFTDVGNITDPAKKELAIKENARELVLLAESSMQIALSEHKGKYYTNGLGNAVTRAVNPNILTTAFEMNVFDDKGKEVANKINSDFDKIFVAKVNANNANIGYTKLSFNSQEIINGKKMYSNKVTKIVFKSNMMTGSTKNPDNWTYDVATDTLTNTPG